MNPLRFSLGCALAAATIGCHEDAVTNSPVVPMAAIHFANAVPDTNKMAFRVVDIVSNAGLYGATFRSANMFYAGLEAGSRQIKVFFDTTDVVLAQTVLSDVTSSYTANQGYTFIEAGFARSGSTPARAVWIVADNPPDPGASNVGFRVIHAGAGLGAVDVYLIRRQQDTLALTGPVVTNLGFGSTPSNYGAVRADTGAEALRVVVTATGTTAPILANVALPAGQQGTSTLNPIAGARVVGSVMTAVFVPRSVAGSPAPQALTTPSAVILVDRRPPDTAR